MKAAAAAPGLEAISGGLAGAEPRLAPDGPRGRAAVAAILRPGPARRTQLLLIERARQEGDPWSGDLAFPGGRMEPVDADARAAAERETLEEVGLDLATARPLGRLDDRPARVLPITVSAFVYRLDGDPPLVLSNEVQRAFWTPLDHVVDEARRCEQPLERDGVRQRFPAVDLLGPGRPRLWGVTYGFICALLAHAGHRLPTEPRFPPPPASSRPSGDRP